MNFEQISYQKHENSNKGEKNNSGAIAHYSNWFDNYTVDLWRHLGMFSVLNPLLEDKPDSKWITIGDGQFGTAATYIEKKGSKATAIDIDDTLLQIAFEKKMIKQYKKCNAEALPFENSFFDYSYCKQSYHHFPRPFVALYEMIRVSKYAVVLTEPADWIPLPIVGSILQKIKRGLKTILGKTNIHHDTGIYEPDGNYVFTISEREIEKIAVALNFPAIAYKRYNDIYIQGVENKMYNKTEPLLKKIKQIAFIRKIKENFGLQRPNNIQMIIFKTQPSENVITKLKKQKYKYVSLPKNPYL